MRLTVRLVGAVTLAAGSLLFWLKLNVELQFGNLGSDPTWVPPVPTAYDRIMLQMPVLAISVIGTLLLIASFLKRRKRK